VVAVDCEETKDVAITPSVPFLKCPFLKDQFLCYRTEPGFTPNLRRLRLPHCCLCPGRGCGRPDCVGNAESAKYGTQDGPRSETAGRSAPDRWVSSLSGP